MRINQHARSRGLYIGSVLQMIVLFACAISAHAASPLPAFEVASIRRTETRVNFERDGRTEASHGMLRMRDVTLSTCIHWAYGLQQSQIIGPSSLADERYDITAKAGSEVEERQLRLMLRTLLTERFRLTFHQEKKELHVLALTTAKGGFKIKPAANEGAMDIHGIAKGMVAKSVTMSDLVEYLSGPLEMPLVDSTGLSGKYDFRLDFTPYLDAERKEAPNPAAIINAVLQGELGLKLVPHKQTVDVMVIDHFESPTSN